MTQPASGTLVAQEPGSQPDTGSAPYAASVPLPATLVAPRVPGSPVPRAVALAALAYGYRRRQFAIANHAQTSLQNLWQHYINPAKFADSWEALKPTLFGAITQQHDMAAANAVNFYQNARVTAGLGYLPLPGTDLDAQYVERVMQSMGPGTFFHQVKEADSEEASQIASRAIQGAGTRLVLSGGRNTITKAAVDDPNARGWERVIEPGACAFCAMLAGRGGVYTSSTVKFRAHDHCGCLAEPVFGDMAPTNEALSKQWGEATKGKHGKAALAAWEQHWSRNDNSVRTSLQSGTPPASGRREIRSGQ